jgi:hypothetical protein
VADPTQFPRLSDDKRTSARATEISSHLSRCAVCAGNSLLIHYAISEAHDGNKYRTILVKPCPTVANYIRTSYVQPGRPARLQSKSPDRHNIFSG